MNAEIFRFPSNHLDVVAEELIHLSSGLKRDMGKYTKYRHQDVQNPKVKELGERCRSRIFARLEKVANLQEEYNIDPESWRIILHQALKWVHKHKESPELQKEANHLFRTYYNDATHTKVEFVLAYMELVARMKPSQISIAFHG